MQCATHPDVETELGCSRCGKAICPRCLVHTPVGARCRECANVRRIPTYNVSADLMLRGRGSRHRRRGRHRRRVVRSSTS